MKKNFRTIKEYLQNADFKDLNFLFAYKNDEFVGFLGADKECIQMLFVKPEYFRKKIGSKLLQKALDDFKIKKVEVNLDNPNALKFYQKFGFEKVGEYKDDFGFILIKMEIKS
ncbi:TPA: GNAT family N-acetyltransferase [Campylobacter coli]|nr:GNAT family N-acetyltransferase [Campylobacter coli]